MRGPVTRMGRDVALLVPPLLIAVLAVTPATATILRLAGVGLLGVVLAEVVRHGLRRHGRDEPDRT